MLSVCAALLLTAWPFRPDVTELRAGFEVAPVLSPSLSHDRSTDSRSRTIAGTAMIYSLQPWGGVDTGGDRIAAKPEGSPYGVVQPDHNLMEGGPSPEIGMPGIRSMDAVPSPAVRILRDKQPNWMATSS